MKNQKPDNKTVSIQSKNKANSNEDERRKSKRLPVKMLVDYRSDGNYLFDFSYNLGSGGIFIQTENTQPLNSEVKIMFTLPNTDKSFEVVGKVMWVQPKLENDETPAGMGLQFLNLSNEQRAFLNNYLEEYARPKNLELDESA